MKSLLRLLLPIASLAFIAPAQAQKGSGSGSATAIPGGAQSTTFVINKPGAYYLAGDRVMSDVSKPAIEITASDVSLDLAGFAVSFTGTAGAASAAGIAVPIAVNVEIRNGTICHAPGAAVESPGTTGDGLRLIDVRIADTRGILSGAANTLLDRCHIVDTRSLNAVMARAQGTVIRNCQIRNVLAASGLVVAGGAQVVSNTINNTYATGIWISSSGPQTDIGNTVADNLVRNANTSGNINAGGIVIDFWSAVVKNNHVTHARGTGIRANWPAIIEGNSVSETVKDSAQTGGFGYTTNGVAILRNNSGMSNQAGFIGGNNYVNGGGNIGF